MSKLLWIRSATIVACIVFVSSSVLIPNVFSQVGNIKVLSYSWHVNSSGELIVVGEVQNTGKTVLQSVSLKEMVYAANGTQLVSSITMPYVNYLLPQQKAPFYVNFGTLGTNVTSTVSYVKFGFPLVPQTSDQEYQGLSLNPVFNGVSGGAYIVRGSLVNGGNQTANDIAVVGTYYNSSGTVVAVGFDILNGSLSPNNSASFTVSEFDATPSIVAQISNYSLLVQTSTLQINSTSSASPSPSPSPSPSATLSPIPSIPEFSSWIILSVLAIVALLTVILVGSKRKSKFCSFRGTECSSGRANKYFDR